MGARYLAVICREPALLRRAVHEVEQRTGLPHAFQSEVVSLFSEGSIQPLGGHGILIGQIHSRASGPLEIDQVCQDRIVRSGGRALLKTGWGGYVGITNSPDADEIQVFRAPLGRLPCYWWQSHKLTLIASDVASLVAAGMPRPSIDHDALARHIIAEDLRREETCLAGVSELQGGDRLILSPVPTTTTTEHLWSPWQFATGESDFLDPADAARQVRAAVQLAVTAEARGRDAVILKLSGGIDSSIVAACLAYARVPMTALNLVTDHPAGDEREHARLVAAYLSIPLEERFRRIADVDVTRSAAVRLPRPTARSFTQTSAVLAHQLAEDTGSRAIFDGGGGDNLFCSLQSARPVADCLLSKITPRRILSTAHSISQLAEVSIAAVVRRAIAQVCRRSRAYPVDLDERFIRRDVVAEVATNVRHPWLVPPSGILPGKAAHIALIAAAQSVVEGADPQDELPSFSPLISQPVVEACLRVPTWLWFRNGQNRYVARDAFRDVLPQAIVDRQSKGAPDCFVAEIYETNRASIRDLLLGGVLAAGQLIDLPMLETALSDPAPVQGHDFLRIMHLTDAEAWARAWQ